MGLLKQMVLVGVVVGAIILRRCMKEPDLPTLDPKPWWGSGDLKEDDPTISPFKINVSDKDLEDFRLRLSLPLRLIDPLKDSNFTYGFNSKTLEKIVDYWINQYDWKKREQRLNAVPQFKTQIEGLDIHFLRARRNARINVKIVPLLLIHGWPGSVVEFYDILPLLANPQEGSDVAFEIICPSLPGFGFSDSAVREGLGPLEMAQLFLKLMKRLGFEKFYVQGGDWGSIIASNMATLYPENVLGVHLNMVTVNSRGSWLKLLLGSVLPSGLLFSAEDEPKIYPIWGLFVKFIAETGYFHIQATKPDTVGIGLSNSPIGLAAYILEKFSTGTDYDNRLKPDGGLLTEFPISLDTLLDNLSIYWFSKSATSSLRIYAEYSKDFSKNLDSHPCRVPAGLAMFPMEVVRFPINIAAYKFYDIVSYTDMPKCGHFAAMECPDLLAHDVHQFVTKIQKRNTVPQSNEL